MALILHLLTFAIPKIPSNIHPPPSLPAALHGLPKQPEIAHNAYFQLQIREVL